MSEASPTLSAGDLELALNPSVGGAIARFDWLLDGARTPILRASPEPLRNVLQAASFPLVPYVNRISGGCFTFQGRRVELEPNMPGDPSPLHGQGWLSPWSVESANESEATLRFDHQAGEWPWAYEARQHFRLTSGGLRIRITCRNTSDEPMPCGLGIHPYFNCSPQTRIQTAVEHVWTVDENVLPVDKVPATGRYDIADANVCGRDLDNGYGGWSGRTLLTDPGWPFEIELASEAARFFQLYSPKQGGIFVAEPVSHANDALSEPDERWAELGIRILDPGQEIDLEARIDVRPAAR